VFIARNSASDDTLLNKLKQDTTSSIFTHPIEQRIHKMSAGGSWKDLFLAAEEGDIPKARYHLGLGVDPNFQHPEYFTAPLFEAIRHGHLGFVKVLVEEGKADPSLVEELTDDSALDIALAFRQFEILDYLNTRLPPGERWSPHHVVVTTIGTGRNLEIGKEICRRFLEKGHRVVLVYSGVGGGDDKVQDGASTLPNELRLETKNPHIDCIAGSLETVTSVRALADQIRKRVPLLNTLIHNAAVWATEPHRNEDGLEVSFMVNYMARHILTNELMPVLKTHLHSRVLHFLPDQSLGPASLSAPDPNATPFGKDFHGYGNLSGTAGYHSGLAFLTAAEGASESSVTVSAVQAGRIAYALPSSPFSTAMWMSYFLSWAFYFLNLVLWIDENPFKLVTASEPFLLAETREFERLHGRILHAQSGLTTESIDARTRSVLLGGAGLEEWEQWTSDFLSRGSKEL